MNEDKMKALAAELAKDIKTPEDLSAFSAQLTKITVEAALITDMEEHLPICYRARSQLRARAIC